MSDESEYDCGEDCLDDGDSSDCDYGFSEFCVDPHLRNLGCCFECWLFQEVDEADREEAERREEIEQKVRNPT